MRKSEASKEIVMSYDKEADVFYISLGRPKKTMGEELSSGVVKRVDPKSRKVVGFTIIGFSEVFEKKKEVKVPIAFAV